jgi:hypothetical protein
MTLGRSTASRHEMPNGKSVRLAAVALCATLCAVIGATPVAALATTGTNTDKRTVVTITKRGVTYKPALKTMHLTTGVTLRVHIVNKAPGRHVFRFGTHKTKVMKSGGSYTFYYVLDTPGKYRWEVLRGHVKGKHFHGTYVLPLPSHFH